VPCKARLGLRDIRYGVAAEPESIVSAGVAGRLSVCRARIPGHCAGQQSEHYDCCEPKTSGRYIVHLAQSSQPSCDPPPSTPLPRPRPNPSFVREGSDAAGKTGRLISQNRVCHWPDRAPAKGAALSNAMAAQPFHGDRFCQCGRLADRLGCRRTRRHSLPATQ
jgi:hypothetical protein